MPYVSGIYQLLPNVYGAPNQPIQSAPYNSQLDDLAAAQNAARPISAGGTGAQTRQAALNNFFTGSEFVQDGTFFIADSADNTKKFRFEVGAVAPGATRVLTLPDVNVTINAIGAAVIGADNTAKANDAITTFSTDIASNTTTDLSTATGVNVMITGNNNITSFGSVPAGAHRLLIFGGALKITHNALSLVLPNAVDITTMPGDTALMQSFFPGKWRCIHYQRASKIAFSVDKNGGAQNIVSTGAVVTFSTKRFDVGDYFNSGTNSYQPPAGRYRLSATMFISGNLTAGAPYALTIRRNGALIAADQVIAGSGSNGFSLRATVIANSDGSDTFDVYYPGSGSAQIVDGNPYRTRFEGEEI